ncbi:hypothetical protein [Sulfitobacter alexandrii]|uniref:hypothetical protein n=1 Tax=Sulfitobacter alexandrii TaxID=1917485 RepID=UPI0012EBDB32|nr:hypothetical protein [Sulfitobacter alexandrii]
MTKTERDTDRGPRATAASAWRDIVQSGGDAASIEGVALEHLMDLERGRATGTGQ